MMETKNHFVKATIKPNGFSYIELLISIFFLINIFVLFTQIFYNIYNNNLNEIDNKIFKYEVTLSRIEYHLKEAEAKPVIDNVSISFVKGIYHYKYCLDSNNNFVLEIRQNTYKQYNYYLKNIKSVNFTVKENLVKVIFIDNKDLKYESKIILPSIYQ